MTAYGAVTLISTPVVPRTVTAYAVGTGHVGYAQTAAPISTPVNVRTNVSSYIIAGTRGYAPPTWGQLWPRGDIDAT